MKIQSDSLRLEWTDHDQKLQVCLVDFNGVVVDGDNEIKVKVGDELFRPIVGELKIVEPQHASSERKTEKILRSRTEPKEKGTKDKDRSLGREVKGVRKEKDEKSD